MELQQFLKNYPQVRLASTSDSCDIQAYFNQSSMDGKDLKVRYERTPDFFAFLNFTSPRHYVFILEALGGVKGVGTLLVRPGYIDGVAAFVGQLGDLRVSSGKKNTILWRRFYADLIAHAKGIEELKDVSQWITAIIDQNSRAINGLVRAQKNNFHYQIIAPYKMVNIFSPKAWQLNRAKRGVLRRAGEEDLTQLRIFLRRGQQESAYGFVESDNYSELDFRLKNWRNFKIEDYFLLLDDKDENRILLAFALWNPSPYKKIIIEKIPLFIQTGLKLLNFIKKAPKKNAELKVQYLTHLTFERMHTKKEQGELLSSAVSQVFSAHLMQDFHFLAYCDFNHDSHLASLKNFITFQTPMALYEVTTNNPSIKTTQLKSKISFEMALV